MAYNPLNPNGSATSANSQPVVIASDQGALPISSATLATAARQDTGNTSVASIDTKLPSGLTVTANRLQVELPAGGSGLTDTELRATAVPVSGTVTANLSATDNAVLDTIDTSTAAVNTKTPALGQALAASSTPVVLTAAQVTTLTPPAAITGFATSANQTTIIGHVDGIEGTLTTMDADTGSIDTKTPALGQALAASSVPVVLTAAQITTLTPLATVAVTGVATLAEQQTQTTALQLIDNAISGAGFNITQLGSAAVPVGAGLEATAIRVTLPTDGTGVVKLGAGTAGIGKLTANSGVDIGDVDILSIAAGDNNIGNVDIVTLPALIAGTALIGKVGIDQATANANEVVTKTGSVTAATLGAETTKVIGTINIAAAQTLATVTTVTALTGGGVAHDGADSGNPHKIGGRATNVEIAAVANNDRTDAVFTLTGKQIIQPYTNHENIVSGITTAMTATTSTAVTGMGAPGAGLRNYITSVVIGNSHATVGTFVDLQDGSAGTVFATFPAAAVFGGAAPPFPVAIRQPTANTALFAVNKTTGANVIVFVNGYKAV